MNVPCMLQVSWMKIGCKLHLDVIIVLTWYHVIELQVFIMLQTSNEKNFWYPSISTIFDTLNSSLHHRIFLFIVSKVNFLRLHVLATWSSPMTDNWSCMILVGFMSMLLIMYHEWIVHYLNMFNFA
jgi:hypothetical protein